MYITTSTIHQRVNPVLLQFYAQFFFFFFDSSKIIKKNKNLKSRKYKENMRENEINKKKQKKL